MISSALRRRSVPWAKAFLLLLTVTDTISLSQAKFLVGRIHPSDYDLPELNGLYRPREAADLCDSHPICAGFTYRGLMNNTAFPQKE